MHLSSMTLLGDLVNVDALLVAHYAAMQKRVGGLFLHVFSLWCCVPSEVGSDIRILSFSFSTSCSATRLRFVVAGDDDGGSWEEDHGGFQLIKVCALRQPKHVSSMQEVLPWRWPVRWSHRGMEQTLFNGARELASISLSPC